MPVATLTKIHPESIELLAAAIAKHLRPKPVAPPSAIPDSVLPTALSKPPAPKPAPVAPKPEPKPAVRKRRSIK
jgi:hypothetical protein